MSTEETALNILKDLVSIPSVNPFRLVEGATSSGIIGFGAESKINLYLEQLLKQFGFEVTRQYLHEEVKTAIGQSQEHVPARWNVLAVRYPKGRWNNRSILFFGHTDTVDVKEGWKTDPFTISVVNEGGSERWYALGANDMKAGLAAILAAISSAETNEYALKVAFVVDEEYYSLGADHLVKSEFLGDVDVAIAPEIGDTNSTIEKGQSFAIGRVGRVEIDFEVLGKACHGVDALVSKQAVNAVHESATLQCAVSSYCKELARTIDYSGVPAQNSAFISYHTGGMPSLSVPDKASFVLDRTFLPDESLDEELKKLNLLVASLKERGGLDQRTEVRISSRKRPTPPCQSFLVDFKNPAVCKVTNQLSISTENVVKYFGRSVGDENRIAAAGIPTLTIGPSGAGSHTSSEWVDPESIVKLVVLYRAIINDH